MNYYPVCITTLNRYTHFKRCVESLARNTHADKTELVIGLDYPPEEKYVEGYLKIKSYIPTIKGFKKVTVFEWTENYGPSKNSLDLIDYCFRHYDAVILTEDDNEFSPCFLDYMNKALEAYATDPHVYSASAYIGRNYYGKLRQQLMFNYDNNAWGLGLWKSKEQNSKLYTKDYFKKIILSFSQSYKVFRVSPGIFSMLVDMVKLNQSWGDVESSARNIINGTYQLRPSFSLVRNTGFDGTGIHCGISDPNDLAHQIISEELFFNYNFCEVADVNTPAIRKQLSLHCIPHGFIRRQKFFLVLVLKYLKLRFCLK